MTMEDLGERIRQLYDRTTGGWVDVWGEHLHHGHYGSDGSAKVDHQQAQVDMVDRLLDWAGPVEGPTKLVLDAGCGVGGSARHLATRLGAEVEGLTLSPVQAGIARRLSAGRPDVRFTVADATRAPFETGSFDLVWALESAEHMPDKGAFLRECSRVLRPGGRLVLATWCHRPEPPPLHRRDRLQLDTISWSYGRSLTWVSESTYSTALAEGPWTQARTEDWSAAVAPFWAAVLRSVVTKRGLLAVARGGRRMVAGAYGGLWMRGALATGLVRYVVATAVRGDA